MVKISVGKDAVTLKLDGAQKFFALKRKVTIPLENISKVSTEQVKPIWLPKSRLGTHVPGVFMAGTFWLRKGGKTFYYARNFSNCITLTLKNHEYNKVVVEVDKDKEALASRIREVM
jgi:PH (Pleckstrin Homology) domain-containing protein